MEPSREAAAAGQVMTLENAPQVLGDIERLKTKEKNGALTKDEQIDLHHAENLLARAQVTNLEAKQKALSKLAAPRDLHSTELEALAKAKSMLARPWPGTAPKPEPQTTAPTTQSSSSLPPGDTSTTHGVTPPTGTATSSQAGTGDTTGTAATGSTTSTASSGDTTAPGGTHTTNGVAAPPVGHGNRIPEDTTHPEHIDLANRREKMPGMNGTQLRTLIVDWESGENWTPQQSVVGAPTFCRLWANVPDASLHQERYEQPVLQGACAGADKMSALPALIPSTRRPHKTHETCP